MSPVATTKGACPLCGPNYPAREVAASPDFEYRTTGAQEFRFARCGRCDTIVLDPRPADDEIPGLYPAEYQPYRFDELNRLVKAGRTLVQRRKVDVISRYVRQHGVIVDVGCGNGALLHLIRTHTGNAYELIGWDYPGAHLERLAASGMKVIAAPIEPAHAPAGVDLFVLNQVIEHFAHPDRLLAMLAGSLRRGGHIIIETPDTSGLDAHLFSKRYWGGYHTPRHMVLFNQRNLRELVERSGLRVVETVNLASPAFWIQSLHHLASESRAAWLASLCTLRNVPLVALASAFDLARGRVTSTSNQRLVAEMPV
jgi:SAM-dependent methyltransferase